MPTAATHPLGQPMAQLITMLQQGQQKTVPSSMDDPTVHLLLHHLYKGEKPLLIVAYATDLGCSYDPSEQVLSEQDGQSIIVKMGAKKLKLENISPAQWIGANARIMAELL